MLTENKFSKYLIYAIGEIILVVIGILIALNINNRNEFDKSSKETVNNLNQIKYELGQDIIFFKEEVSYSKWIIKYFNHIKLKEFDSANVKKTFKRISGNLSSLDLSRSYDKLNESGNIDIIKDSILINALHDYFLEERNDYNKNSKFNIGFTSDKIEGYLIYKLELDENLETTESSVINELENGKLKNLINYQSEIYKVNEVWAGNMLKKAEKIIKLINEEVNN